MTEGGYSNLPAKRPEDQSAQVHSAAKVTGWTCSCGRRNGPTVFCAACLKDRV